MKNKLLFLSFFLLPYAMAEPEEEEISKVKQDDQELDLSDLFKEELQETVPVPLDNQPPALNQDIKPEESPKAFFQENPSNGLILNDELKRINAETEELIDTILHKEKESPIEIETDDEGKSFSKKEEEISGSLKDQIQKDQVLEKVQKQSNPDFPVSSSEGFKPTRNPTKMKKRANFLDALEERNRVYTAAGIEKGILDPEEEKNYLKEVFSNKKGPEAAQALEEIRRVYNAVGIKKDIPIGPEEENNYLENMSSYYKNKMSLLENALDNIKSLSYKYNNRDRLLDYQGKLMEQSYQASRLEKEINSKIEEGMSKFSNSQTYFKERIKALNTYFKERYEALEKKIEDLNGFIHSKLMSLGSLEAYDAPIYSKLMSLVGTTLENKYDELLGNKIEHVGNKVDGFFNSMQDKLEDRWDRTKNWVSKRLPFGRGSLKEERPMLKSQGPGDYGKEVNDDASLTQASEQELGQKPVPAPLNNQPLVIKQEELPKEKNRWDRMKSWVSKRLPFGG
jgi:hypothetical protein